MAGGPVSRPEKICPGWDLDEHVASSVEVASNTAQQLLGLMRALEAVEKDRRIEPLEIWLGYIEVAQDHVEVLQMPESPTQCLDVDRVTVCDEQAVSVEEM